MPFYEVIYETGEKSVASYDSDKEAKAAVQEHVDRAMSGEAATPASTPRMDLGEEGPVGVASWPANRVVKVLVYNEHPYDYLGKASNVSVEVIASIAKDTAVDGVVNIPELTVALLASTNPLIDEPGAHESMYKMKETKELAL